MFCLSLEKKIKKIKKSLLKSAKKDPLFTLFVILIVFLAVFFRYYNYFDRIYVHADNALFAQAAKYAQDNLKFPQIGPFAQAPFFTGPWWLWILAIFFFIPLGFLTPWYMISISSLIFIFLIFWLGKEIGGKWFGAIAALLAAVSPAQIDNSFSIWNAAADSFLALLAMTFLVRFYKLPRARSPRYCLLSLHERAEHSRSSEVCIRSRIHPRLNIQFLAGYSTSEYKGKRAFDIFLLGFIVSLAITIHFQTFLLTPLVLAAILTARPKLKNFIYLAIGFVIPFLPFLFFDLRFGWFWFRSVYIYITIDQYMIWVPNRWLTYAGIYWPQTWGQIIGGGRWLGGLVIVLLSMLTLLRLKDFKKYKLFYLIAISFVLEVILFRYWRGERFSYFSNFAHPAVVILTAWVIVEIYKLNKTAGIILGLIIFSASVLGAYRNLEDRQITFSKIKSLRSEIYAKYPKDKFEVYGCVYSGALISHPLSLMMYSDGRDDASGVKIGVCYLSDKSINWTILRDEDVKEEKSPWLDHSTSNVYKTMTEWWKENPPK